MKRGKALSKHLISSSDIRITHVFTFLTILVVFFNLAVFVMANSIPILWQQGEVTYLNLFWSAQWEGLNDLHLASGLRTDDFWKIFASTELEGIGFRTRHFAYLMEMLSFKFWQWAGVSSFRNYTLIGLHVFNSALIFALTRQLTKNHLIAVLTSLLALNSGIALATLLFPFRINKLLAVALFLLGWICVVSAQGKFVDPAKKRMRGFFVILLLALFTDEVTVFLFPVVFAYIFLTENIDRDKFRHLAGFTILTAGIYGLLRTFCSMMDAVHSNMMISTSTFYLSKISHFYRDGHFLYDSLRAGLAYFLRKNFGSWEWSGGGIVAFLSFMALTVFALIKPHQPVLKRCALIILSVVVIKSICFPLIWIDPVIMPPDTVFPSTLYFGYYYSYCEAMLVTIAGGLLWMKTNPFDKNFFLLGLLAVSAISASNLLHVRQAIQPALETHGFYRSHQHAIPHILQIEHLDDNQKSPIYLSFPSGSRPYFSRPYSGPDIWVRDPAGQRQQLSPYFMNYASIIPVHYLREMEAGRLLMSLKNVQPPQPFPDGEELKQARFFYDVPNHELLDLAPFKKISGLEGLNPIRSQSASILKAISLTAQDRGQELLIFVKGAARVTVQSVGIKQVARQRYGYSYQLFRFPMKDFLDDEGSVLEVIVSPVEDGGTFDVVGPFLKPF